MIEISGENVDEVFVKACKKLINEGIESSPRGLKTLELEDVILTVKNPIQENMIITIPERSLNLEYLHGEMNWYLNGSYDVSEISRYSKFWNNLASKSGRVCSNYGMITLKEVFNGYTQYDWCREKLKEDPQSRQAVMNYNQPKHKFDGNKDLPCTLSQAFRIKENKLTNRVVMRASDLVFGYSFDAYWFAYLQNKLAADLDVGIGEYIHYAISLHVYERHFDMLEKINKNHG